MRVLSIQSHVVHGYVGNKAAVFPLQLLGFDVDVINSVQFSNHTGYDQKWEGDVLNGGQLDSLLDGLERNDLLKNTQHLLTGYIGSESFLRSVIRVLNTLKKYNSDFRYVCDPVFGDDGKLYVPAELVDIYRKEVIPLSNIVTPNQFEVEQLTGMTVNTMDDAKKAADVLHLLGPEIVVITSMRLEGKEDYLTILASQRFQLEDGTSEDEIWCIESPILEGRYTGTGDVTAALLLAWSAKDHDNLGSVLEKTVSTMYTLIETTMKQRDGTVAGKELKLIQSKFFIENPPTLFKAKRLI
jgi:pyridoxine kinase